MTLSPARKIGPGSTMGVCDPQPHSPLCEERPDSGKSGKIFGGEIACATGPSHDRRPRIRVGGGSKFRAVDAIWDLFDFKIAERLTPICCRSGDRRICKTLLAAPLGYVSMTRYHDLPQPQEADQISERIIINEMDYVVAFLPKSLNQFADRTDLDSATACAELMGAAASIAKPQFRLYTDLA